MFPELCLGSQTAIAHETRRSRRNALANIFEGIDTVQQSPSLSGGGALSPAATDIGRDPETGPGRLRHHHYHQQQQQQQQQLGDANLSAKTYGFSAAATFLENWCIDCGKRLHEESGPAPGEPGLEQCRSVFPRMRRNALHDLLDTLSSSERDRLRNLYASSFSSADRSAPFCH